MNIAILGFGREGKSLLRFLRREPRYRRATFWILDKNPAVRRGTHGMHARLRLGKNYLKNLSDFDVVFRSPGVPYTLPEIQHARKKGVEISSATKLFFDRAPREKLIGITGTKGKGTTSTLLADMLERAGFKTVLAGNIGKPMLDALPAAKKADFVILELSSFQLQDLTTSPHIAAVLDIFPDHLDAHKHLKEYYAAKANIGRFQTSADCMFYFATNPRSRIIAMKSPGQKIAVRPAADNLRKNYEMAAAIAARLGVQKPVIEKSIASFRGLAHRLEFVRKIRTIRFYDDSAGTNPIATIAAIRSFQGPIVLIAGGKNKGFDYRPLGHAIRTAHNVQHVVLFGENKYELKRKLGTKSKKPEITLTNNVRSAVRYAYNIARSLVTGPLSIVTVLLSPASASLDMFKNYADRGEQFKKAVKALKASKK